MGELVTVERGRERDEWVHVEKERGGRTGTGGEREMRELGRYGERERLTDSWDGALGTNGERSQGSGTFSSAVR